MKKIEIIFIGIMAIILVILGGIMFLNKNKPLVPQEETEISQTEGYQEVNLIINKGEGPLITIKSEFKEGMTVFSLLEERAKELDLSLKTQTFDFGVMVEAIGDKENGEDGKYWLYYVNGEMPMVSADKKEINPGDNIEFKFEKSPF